MGALSLPASGPVYADTQILIYTVERHPVYGPFLQPLWTAVQNAGLEVVSSELALMETLVQPIRMNNVILQADYERSLLGTEMRLLPISLPILREAARLRAAVPALRTPDAIHAATALLTGCALFITNDNGFRRVPGLPFAILDEVIAS